MMPGAISSTCLIPGIPELIHTGADDKNEATEGIGWETSSDMNNSQWHSVHTLSFVSGYYSLMKKEQNIASGAD